MTYPNRFQKLILDRIAEISRDEGETLSDATAAKLCGMPPTTFAQMVNTDFGDRRQFPGSESIPRIAEGLKIPLEDLLDAAAWVAGYRRKRYDESDLLSVVRFWLTDDLDQAQIRQALRVARNMIQHGLDEWATESGLLPADLLRTLLSMRSTREELTETLDRLEEELIAKTQEEIAADEAADAAHDLGR